MDRTPITDVEVELMHQRANIHSLMRRVHALEELVDVLATPPWKRLWFWLRGWRLYKVGRWYGD
jgi:hypothetical protein